MSKFHVFKQCEMHNVGQIIIFLGGYIICETISKEVSDIFLFPMYFLFELVVELSYWRTGLQEPTWRLLPLHPV